MQLKGGLTALVLTRPDFHHLLRFYALYARHRPQLKTHPLTLSQ
jgi:hypothetical protein